MASSGGDAKVGSTGVEFRETGTGPNVVLAAGSCSTGAAWRATLKHLPNVRAITTSVCGYGQTAERRTSADRSIGPVAEALEEVVRRAGPPVHLVGHSFGGLAALAVALRKQVDLVSLTIFEAPAPGALIGVSESGALAGFRSMTNLYEAAHRAGDPDAIGAMIDFYGGPGSWAEMPEPVQDYARTTTPVNLIDWESAYGFALGEELVSLARLNVVVVVGARSNPIVKRANALVAQRIPRARFIEVDGAAHFMISSHPADTAKIIASQVHGQHMPPAAA